MLASPLADLSIRFFRSVYRALRRANVSRKEAHWSDDDYDVFDGHQDVGRIFRVCAITYSGRSRSRKLFSLTNMPPARLALIQAVAPACSWIASVKPPG